MFPRSMYSFRRSAITVAIFSTFGMHAGAADMDSATTTQPVEMQAVSVVGKGQTRQVESITSADQREQAPGTSAIKTVEKLPGVNYQAADPYGAYEWAVRISVRGFNQNQMGFTLDGIPLGDMSYGNYNGLHISRAVISENMGKAVFSPGAGSLDTASTSNLGGTLQFYSADPANAASITGQQTVGSDNALRTYLRVESGKLSTGTKAYLSYVNQDQEKWKGDGHQKYNQLNLKVVQSLAAATTLTAYLDLSNRKEVDYQDLSKEYISKLGYNWDNYFPDWSTAVAAAQGVYTHGEQTTSDPLDAAYYAGSGLRRDLLGGLSLKSKLAAGLTLTATPYIHHDVGRGLWYTPYTASANILPGETQVSPISLRTTEYSIAREGLVSDLSYALDAHKIDGGFWIEHNGFDQARRFYDTGYSTPGNSPYEYTENPFYTQWQYKFGTNTQQYHLQDTWQVVDSVAVNAGFKGTNVSSSAKTEVGSPNLNGTIKTARFFLPQAGVVWTLPTKDEVFASAAENMRAFPAAHTGVSPFATTQSGFDYIKDTLQPETSWTEEVGYRLMRKSFEGVASVYHVYFRDRLIGKSAGAGIQGNPTTLANVGSVVTNGAEVSGLWRFYPGASWYNAAAYNKSTYQENVYYSDGSSANTKGNQVVDAPVWMYKSELSYEKAGFFSNLSGNYMSQRYYTYENDNPVGMQFVVDLGLGYKTGPIGMAKDLTAQLNVYNLLDRQYISSIGTNGFVDNDPNGTAQTLMVGAPRSLFMTLGAKF